MAEQRDAADPEPRLQPSLDDLPQDVLPPQVEIAPLQSPMPEEKSVIINPNPNPQAVAPPRDIQPQLPPNARSNCKAYSARCLSHPKHKLTRCCAFLTPRPPTPEMGQPSTPHPPSPHCPKIL